MAFWLYLVSVAYVFIWIVLGEQNGLNESVLILLGVSSGTSLGSTVLDNSKKTQAAREEEELAKEHDKLKNEVAVLAASDGEEGLGARSSADHVHRAIKEGELQRVRSKIDALPTIRERTAGFLRDVLYDANGPSLSRLQMFGWTLILGMVFCRSVYAALTMPEFSGTMLSLMGLSSGTFLALKGPEKPATEEREEHEEGDAAATP